MAYFHTNVLDNQIKALPTVDTASGSVATFGTDLTENLIECVCDIQYSQAEGTPTPDNPIPIQVFDSLTLYHNDINMWDEQWETGSYNGTTGLPSSNASFSRSVHSIVVKPNTKLYFFVTGINSTNNFFIWEYDKNGNYISPYHTITSNGSYTLSNNTHYLRISYRRSVDTIADYPVSINYPSTDTEYHAFNGAYIPFGQTVAKGTHDVLSGVLTVTHFAFKGTGLNLVKTGTSGNLSTFQINFANNGFPTATVNSAFSSHFSRSIASGSGRMAQNADNMFLIIDNTLLSEDTTVGFVNWLIANDVTFYYECATPQVIQLSATQVTALLNENHIWCDTNGDTSVKFLLTVGKKIA